MRQVRLQIAASRRWEQCADIDGGFDFDLITVETLSVFNSSDHQLVNYLGRRIADNSGEARNEFSMSENFNDGASLERCTSAAGC